ncbi:phage capsid scaffolding protein [Escherichia coli]|nr:phage capsid scaffolding protein [Escherichia coli]
MEIRPNFANTGKCHLIGLAVTDDPASLGTEYLQFCSRVQQNPLAGKKDQPGDLFSVATLAELEFEDPARQPADQNQRHRERHLQP